LRAGFHGWVIELEQKIIAFILISTQGGDIHVLNIGVTGRAQRQGLGYRLMNAAEEYAEQTAAKMMFLEVRRSNLKAINLYYKMGFVEIGERKNYYQDAKCAEDALILAKELIV
jgi:ribosomal-protein-alanine N-acetyltransferase